MPPTYQKDPVPQQITIQCVTATHDNYLIYESVGRATWKLVFPTVISMIFSSVYMICDNVLIGKLAANEMMDESTVLAIISLMSPIEQGLIHCLSSIICMGASILISQCVGRQSYLECNVILGNTLLLQCINYFLTVIVLYSFLPILINHLIPNNSFISQVGLSYLRTTLVVSLASFISGSLTGIIRHQGYSFVCCFISFFSTIVNLLFDYLFLCHTSIGLNGAALSASISCLVSGLLSFCFLQSKKSAVHFNVRSLFPNKTVCGSIVKMGLPGLIATVSRSFGTLVSNRLLLQVADSVRVSSILISCWNMLQKWHAIGIVPILAFSQGIIPLLASAYGGRLLKRFRRIAILMVKSVFILALIFGGSLFAMSSFIGNWLSTEEEFQIFFTTGIRWLLSTLLIDAITFCIFTILQATGKGISASVILAAKESILLILQVALTKYMKSHIGFIYAYPIASMLTCILSLILFHMYCKWIFQYVELYTKELIVC